MHKRNRLLAAVGIVAFGGGLGTGAAHAAGTTAGDIITNTVSVNFQVGGVSQTAQSASNQITVDRKVVLTVAGAGATTSVAPGSTGQITAFLVTNSSNDVIDVALAASNQSGGTAAHGGTDVFNLSNFAYYLDVDNNGSYDSGTDTAITYIDELGADQTRRIFVFSDVPIGATNSQVAGVILTGTALAGGAASSQGSVLTATAGANTAGIDTVLADAAGSDDAQYDGTHSARGDYTVSAAVLSVNKYSTLISDPVNGTTNPKAIPGAVMEYCIAVANGAGAATATGLSLSDPLPSTVTYNSGYGIFLNGTVSGSTCAADGTAGGSYSASPTPTVSGTLNDLGAGQSATLRFRVTIQ